jgi:small subunit ribosomal protein S18
MEDQKAQGESRSLEKFQTREWKAGDIYSPHDLSPAEMKKWGKRKSPSRDAFDALNLNPMNLYKVRTLSPIPTLDCKIVESLNLGLRRIGSSL